jgi:hypothetical protein
VPAIEAWPDLLSVSFCDDWSWASPIQAASIVAAVTAGRDGHQADSSRRTPPGGLLRAEKTMSY